jgi:transposase
MENVVGFRTNGPLIGSRPRRGSKQERALNPIQDCPPGHPIGSHLRRSGVHRLLCFASAFEPRIWAIEGATGTGSLLAQQLVAAGETVLDVPPKLSARVRLLATERSDKTDAHDARSAAVVALWHRRLRSVALEDYAMVLRVLAKRHHDLVAHRTRSRADSTPCCATSSKAA